MAREAQLPVITGASVSASAARVYVIVDAKGAPMKWNASGGPFHSLDGIMAFAAYDDAAKARGDLAFRVAAGSEIIALPCP